MKHKSPFPFFILILTLISACFGAAIFSGGLPFSSQASSAAVLGAGETIDGLKSVVAGAPGTFLMQAEGMFLAAWPRNGAYALTVINSTGKPCVDFNAARVNTLDLSGAVNLLQKEGWKVVGPSALPRAVWMALSGYTVELVMAGAQSLPMVFILPVVIVPTPVGVIQ
jgi:hypothetical protein